MHIEFAVMTQMNDDRRGAVGVLGKYRGTPALFGPTPTVIRATPTRRKTCDWLLVQSPRPAHVPIGPEGRMSRFRQTRIAEGKHQAIRPFHAGL